MRPMRCFVGPHGFVYVLRYASWLTKTPHFGRLRTRRGGFDLHIRTRPRFLCSAPTPKFHHAVFTRSEVIVLTNKPAHTPTNPQTNRCHWKHPTFFAMPQRWVIIQRLAAIWNKTDVCCCSRAVGSRHNSPTDMEPQTTARLTDTALMSQQPQHCVQLPQQNVTAQFDGGLTSSAVASASLTDSFFTPQYMMDTTGQAQHDYNQQVTHHHHHCDDYL